MKGTHGALVYRRGRRARRVRAFAATPSASAASSGAPSQLDLAAMPAVKLVVTTAGWQRVSQPALVAAGLDPGIDPARLQLFADGVEQSLSVTGNGDAVFDSGEAIEFYGQGRDTLWTDVADLLAGRRSGRPADASPSPCTRPAERRRGASPTRRCFASERTTSRR